MIINNFQINCLDNATELCKIGAKYGTDKSPISSYLTTQYYDYDYRHSYTSFYSLLFSNLKNKNINLGEIGIASNSSIKMWREYFSFANIYGWDGNEDLIKNAYSHNLKNVMYDYMHTGSEESIKKAFSNFNIKYDILIDDASHLFWDQIRLIRLCVDYLKKDSLLIIEDIDKNIPESEYVNEIKLYGHDQYYKDISFIEFSHNNRNLGKYNNDKIILLTRN